MGFWDIFGKRKSYNVTWTLNGSGEWVYPDEGSETYIDSAYKKLPNVYSVISFILSKTTIVPFEVYKVKSRSAERKYKAMMNDPRNYAKAHQLKNEAYDKVEGSKIEQLLSKPNEYQTIEQLWWDIDGYKMLTGNSYLYHIAAGGTNEIHNVPSPCVDIKVKGNAFAPELSYKLNYLEQPIHGDEMMHFKYWNPITSTQGPKGQYKGLSPLQSCRLLLGRYADADITQGFMFKNMGPGGLLTGDKDTDLTEPQATALQDRFKQQHTGAHKANDVIITPSKLAWTQIGLSAVDLNILEGKREMLSEICNVYNAPIGLFSDTNSTENNMIESRKSLITDAVMPIVEARKGVLNKYFSDKFGGNLIVEFDYSVFPEIQEDLEKQSRSAATMYWISLNEKRALTGYDQDPDPLMDKKYLPMGLTPLDEYGMQDEDIDEPQLNPNADTETDKGA